MSFRFVAKKRFSRMCFSSLRGSFSDRKSLKNKCSEWHYKPKIDNVVTFSKKYLHFFGGGYLCVYKL